MLSSREAATLFFFMMTIFFIFYYLNLSPQRSPPAGSAHPSPPANSPDGPPLPTEGPNEQVTAISYPLRLHLYLSSGK